MQLIRPCFRLRTLLAVGLLAACQNNNAYQPPPPVEVMVSQPVRGSMEDSLELDGLVASTQTVEIRAQVEGRVTAIHFEDGQVVKEGDLLFTIDPRTYAATATGASAQVAELGAQVAYAQSDFDRQQKLYEAGNVSLERFEQSRQKLKALQAQMNAARAGAAGAAVQLEFTRVTAPISGRMSRRMVDRGQLVGAGEPTLLATIVSSGDTYVEFSVSQTDLLWARQYLEKNGIKSGTEAAKSVIVRAALPGEDGFPHVGRIQSVENMLNASTGTLRARGTFENADGKLLPGLFCRVQLVLGESEGVAVPEIALMLDQVGRYVFVVDAKNQIERRNVELGVRKGDLRRVSSGLKGDERVVVRGLAKVRLGSTVKAVDAPPSEEDATKAEAAPQKADAPTEAAADSKPAAAAEAAADPKPTEQPAP